MTEDRIPHSPIEDAGLWPGASLDNVARLRVVAAGLKGAALEERYIDEPFGAVWDFIADLERSVPTFDRTVASIRILEQDDDQLLIRSSSTWRLGFVPMRFDVTLEDGWCWMVSRPHLYVVGMAAVPEGSGTRYAQLEGPTVPWKPLNPLLRTFARLHTRHVRSDIEGIVRTVSSER
ncbi:MAG: hypothetical protein WBA45_01020 [Microthrixaceae bacterium]